MAKIESWHRRHAVMLASQVPENPQDGLVILRLAMQIVTDFLAEPEEAKKAAPVIALMRGAHD